MIKEPYLLVLNIALHRYDGCHWADPLWKKDLEAHLEGIIDLAVACPVVEAPPPSGWLMLSSAVSVCPLPRMNRLAALRLPVIIARLWRAIGNASIVHTGVAGWPFPLGWIAIPIAKLRRKKVVLVVESAFWRVRWDSRVSRLAHWRATFWEKLNVRATAASDVSFFTTRAYRNALHRDGSNPAYVSPAVWIDSEQLIDCDELVDLEPARSGRVLFAGRFTSAKGIMTLLEAAEQGRVPVDFIGDGELYKSVYLAAQRQPQLIRLLAPVGYGPAFTAVLDRYAALVVPTLTDEQPRVIFDAFARGVMVVASATAGNCQIVEHERTGLLFPPGDVMALTATLVRVINEPGRVANIGREARNMVAGYTHAAMHAERITNIKKGLLLD